MDIFILPCLSYPISDATHHLRLTKFTTYISGMGIAKSDLGIQMWGPLAIPNGSYNKQSRLSWPLSLSGLCLPQLYLERLSSSEKRSLWSTMSALRARFHSLAYNRAEACINNNNNDNKFIRRAPLSRRQASSWRFTETYVHMHLNKQQSLTSIHSQAHHSFISSSSVHFTLQMATRSSAWFYAFLERG